MPILLVLLVFVGAMLLFRFWTRRREHRILLETPLSNRQRDIIEQQVPLLKKIPWEIRWQFEGKINAFLNQVQFIGCDGVEVTEAMRLSIAAQACLLIANTDAWYQHLRTILIYPGAFTSLRKKYDGYVVTEHRTVRSGESWARGPVVLSWEDAAQGAANDVDGHNVVFHEFAHQLDDLSGRANGVPILGKGQSFDEWERAFLDAYEKHVQRVENGFRTVIDAYGATNHQEFFAVSVELFFEKPAALKKDEPDVYKQLSILLKLDPLAWVSV